MVCANCSCHAQDASAPADRNDMVGVENSQRVGRPAQAVNGVNGHANGVNGIGGPSKPAQRNNPYAPRASDFLNNVTNFKIIESTLRGPSTSLTSRSFFN